MIRIQSRISSFISIHSLRVEGDFLGMRFIPVSKNFNPLPPCGGRQNSTHFLTSKKDFNPLPPCGGRRDWSDKMQRRIYYFNPLPPCGGRLIDFVFSWPGKRFQSTPSVWRETIVMNLLLYGKGFQSTPSVWRETLSCMRKNKSLNYFNPLPPCGGRLLGDDNTVALDLFQSTPSVWRETHCIGDHRLCC